MVSSTWAYNEFKTADGGHFEIKVMMGKTYYAVSYVRYVNERSFVFSKFASAVVLLPARQMGQYCFARWRLSSSSVVVVSRFTFVSLLAGRPAAGRVDGHAADTARLASRVTSR